MIWRTVDPVDQWLQELFDEPESWRSEWMPKLAHQLGLRKDT